MPARLSQQSALNWRKSKASTADGGCVEAATGGESVLLRDSHDRSGPILVVSPRQWSTFLRRIRDEDRAS
jgi:hypothetical protein